MMSIKRYILAMLVVCLSFPMAFAQSTHNATKMLPKLYQDNGDGFIVIAHRGASAYYPENTMAALKGAVAQQAEMIELDVLMSKDGVPMVFHDATLKRVTNGKGELHDFRLEELRKLDAGSWFDSTFTGEQIPTLEEALAYAAGKIAVNIEIKTEAVTDRLKGGVEEKSLALVQKYEMEEYVIFSSFDYRAINHLKTLAPEMPVALLYEKKQSVKMLPSELVQKYKADAFNCSYRQLTKKWLTDLQSNNIPIFVYTVDQPRRMKSLIEKGVRGIFTNTPDVLRGVISNLNQDSRD